MVAPKKSLGQHWLSDSSALEAITEAAQIKPSDTVLEIGPGLGDLTKYLVEQARHVIAVELDRALAVKLPKRVPAKNLGVIHADILRFNFGELPRGYKIVANIPYYLTGHLLRVLTETPNPPAIAVLLVQKEVARRVAAKPGQMNVISIIVQLFFEVELGLVVPAELFKPPPKVDSQLVILTQHPKPLFHDLDVERFTQVVKASFSGRRKKLRSSLSAGLQISKDQADTLLTKAKVSGDLRAQNLSLKDWYSIYRAYPGKRKS